MTLPQEFADLDRAIRMLPGATAVRTERTQERDARPLVCVETHHKAGTHRFQVSHSPAGVEQWRRRLPRELSQCDGFIERAADLVDAFPFQEWPLDPEELAPAGAAAERWSGALWQDHAACRVDAYAIRIQTADGDGRRSTRRAWVQAFVRDQTVLSVGWAGLVNATRIASGVADADSVSHADQRLHAWTHALGVSRERLADIVAALAPLVVLGGSARYQR